MERLAGLAGVEGNVGSPGGARVDSLAGSERWPARADERHLVGGVARMLRCGAKHRGHAAAKVSATEEEALGDRMNTNQIARIAALVGEPARTAMLLSLMDGRALTAHELAAVGRVSPPTGSRHLGQLVEAGLLQVEQRGRHRYHRLASTEVATLLEGIMQLAARQAAPRRALVTGPKDEAMRWARTCYDHLAGRLGVAITEHLLEDGAIAFDGEAGYATDRCGSSLARMGIVPVVEASAPMSTRRAHCRPCLDWSERRPHLAGRLGAMLCTHCLERGWLRRRAGTRALAVTAEGVAGLRGWLGDRRWRTLAVADAADGSNPVDVS
jgi:DNA-binding transcriptional ArsR family regulator